MYIYIYIYIYVVTVTIKIVMRKNSIPFENLDFWGQVERGFAEVN